MSVEIAWKQNILVTDFHLLKSLLVVFGFGSQAFVCGFSRQNIDSVKTGGTCVMKTQDFSLHFGKKLRKLQIRPSAVGMASNFGHRSRRS